MNCFLSTFRSIYFLCALNLPIPWILSLKIADFNRYALFQHYCLAISSFDGIYMLYYHTLFLIKAKTRSCSNRCSAKPILDAKEIIVRICRLLSVKGVNGYSRQWSCGGDAVDCKGHRAFQIMARDCRRDPRSCKAWGVGSNYKTEQVTHYRLASFSLYTLSGLTPFIHKEYTPIMNPLLSL